MNKRDNPSLPLVSLADVPTYRAGIAQSAAHRLLRRFTEECVSDYGLTMMQWFIIGTVYDTGTEGIGVGELSRRLDTNIPYVTNTLNALETKGIITRTRRTGDGRAKLVTIAPGFLPVIPNIEADLRQKMRDELYATIAPEELQAYITVLYKLSTSLERYE